ncbi:MAG: SRPBCC domain-containing protein [Chloroflexota bacterium]|nr:SRPBCC domain-containing protein [Chloroflexota bacterium]
MADDRVELQTEVDAPRVEVYPLLATSDGLRRWLDDAELEPRVGAAVRVRMRDAEARGEVLAVNPPQHISFTWDWVGSALGSTTVVAFDAIDHGARTHVTIRHVGLPSPRQVELHSALWRYWVRRFDAAARSLPRKIETTHP